MELLSIFSSTGQTKLASMPAGGGAPAAAAAAPAGGAAPAKGNDNYLNSLNSAYANHSFHSLAEEKKEEKKKEESEEEDDDMGFGLFD